MEKVILELEKAKRSIKVADHMLNVTYPMVSDPKILITVLDNVYSSLIAGMSALLFFEEYNKRIQTPKDDFESRFFAFKMHCVDKYKINHKYLPFITDLHSMHDAHEKSPVEFARKGKFVICSENYELKELSKQLLYDFLLKAKVFIDEITLIIHKDSSKVGRGKNGLYG